MVVSCLPTVTLQLLATSKTISYFPAYFKHYHRPFIVPHASHTMDLPRSQLLLVRCKRFIPAVSAHTSSSHVLLLVFCSRHCAVLSCSTQLLFDGVLFVFCFLSRCVLCFCYYWWCLFLFFVLVLDLITLLCIVVRGGVLFLVPVLLVLVTCVLFLADGVEVNNDTV